MVVLSMLVLALTASVVAVPTSAPAPAPATARACAWSSWEDVRHMFVFGDSYTQTGFDVNGAQPNAANPFGNPAYPGWTSSNGPNWIDFLATTYNASFVKTYNLASGGATVDASLVAPYAPTVLSLKDQVAAFQRAYSTHPTSAPWTASDALFAFFIGINDVGNSWWLNNATLYDAIFDVYTTLLGDLYAAGARNLVFLSVPPVERAPLTLNKDDGGYAVEAEGRVILEWNRRLADMASAFGTAHEDAALFVHDTWSVYDRVIKDPAAFEQTGGLRNTTGFCAAYAGGTASWYTKDPSCAHAVNEYLWLNELHPTFPMHNATAASVAEFLAVQRCG